jgi:hypothetical protein
VSTIAEGGGHNDGTRANRRASGGVARGGRGASRAPGQVTREVVGVSSGHAHRTPVSETDPVSGAVSLNRLYIYPHTLSLPLTLGGGFSKPFAEKKCMYLKIRPL